MIVKIKPSAGAMSTSIQYNERKVSGGEAETLCRVNMDGDSAEATRETFARYERLNIRSREVCFHMSINPGPGENLEGGKAAALAGELLQALGYEGQPYVVYRHNDIEREHFHVLSIRVKENGRKIGSFMEQRKCQRTLRELSEKYGYKVGSAESQTRSVRGITPRYFDASSGNVSAQMDAVMEECLKYHFTSERQFSLVMADHNLMMSAKGRQLFIQGLNSEGKKCTGPVCKREFLSRILDRMQECMGEDRSKAARRVAGTGAVLLPYSKSELHYRNMMLKKNIHILFDKDGKGRIVGMTLIDHEGRNVFGSSDTGHELNLAMMQDADENRWQHCDSHQSFRLDVGAVLFGQNDKSKGHEKDPKRRKKRKVVPHI